MHETLRLEQCSREEEQNTHAEMIKEFQALISSDREQKEALQLQVCPTVYLHVYTNSVYHRLNWVHNSIQTTPSIVPSSSSNF